VRYYLDPFGCVKNQVDAEIAMDTLNTAGWRAVADPADAAVIIINSCGFIESAKQESINAVLGYRQQYPDKKIILAGCLAQRYAEELAESLPEADVIFGNRDISKITDAAAAALKLSGTVMLPDPALEPVFSGKRPLLSLPGSGYIKISEGCNNHCTFCAIPHIRGSLVSRPIVHVVEECQQLLDRGIQELCLIGQDIGSYLTDTGKPGLSDLLEALARLEGRFWVRLLYIHPDHFPPPILEILRQDSRFLPYFDLPFQHGSHRILRGMNRFGTPESYLALIERIRTDLPDAVIRSTFLTGFPGETDADFQMLLDFQNKAQLDWAGCFTYSREEDTPAYWMKPRVSKSLAAARKQRVEEQQRRITENRMNRFVGRIMDILVEEAIDYKTGVYLGRLFCHAPEVDGAVVITAGTPVHPGSFIQGSVYARTGFDLKARCAGAKTGV
jgi:ribosomal protein S12 methylthiotransferase